MSRKIVRLSEGDLKDIVRKSVGRIIREGYGSTNSGQFALGAVAGRAAARKGYQADKYGSVSSRAKLDDISNRAHDSAWENVKDIDDVNKRRSMNDAHKQGYLYGYNKGMSESRINEYGDSLKGQDKLGRLSRRHYNRGDHAKSKEVMDYAQDKIRGSFEDYPDYWPNKGHDMSNALMNGWRDGAACESVVRRAVSEAMRRVVSEAFHGVKLGDGFTRDELMELVSTLSSNPIEEMWKPCDLGWCTVQRIESNQVGGRMYRLSVSDVDGSMDLYCEGGNGEVYLQIGRMPNTHWLDEGGYTYMCWKN